MTRSRFTATGEPSFMRTAGGCVGPGRTSTSYGAPAAGAHLRQEHSFDKAP